MLSCECNLQVFLVSVAARIDVCKCMMRVDLGVYSICVRTLTDVLYYEWVLSCAVKGMMSTETCFSVGRVLDPLGLHAGPCVRPFVRP